MSRTYQAFPVIPLTCAVASVALIVVGLPALAALAAARMQGAATSVNPPPRLEGFGVAVVAWP